MPQHDDDTQDDDTPVAHFSIDLLDDDDGLELAAITAAAELRDDDPEQPDIDASIAWVRSRLGDRDRETLDHALDVMQRQADEVVVGVVRRVLGDLREAAVNEVGDVARGEVGDDPHRPLPLLTPAVVADPERLGLAIDRVLRGAAALVRLGREALDLQERVAELTDPDVWLAILRWESAMGDRASTAQEVLIKWGFAEGVRHASRRGR